MAQVRDLGLHEGVHILAGVAPIKSAGAVRFVAERVAGMDGPQAIVEGIETCVEILEQIRQIEGVAGVHTMAMRNSFKER